MFMLSFGKSFLPCCLLFWLLLLSHGTLGQKYPPCNICGKNEKDSITKPDGIFTPPEPNDPVTCRDLQTAGQDGILSVSDCLVLPMIIYDICGCQSTVETPPMTTPSPTTIPPTTAPLSMTTIPVKTKKPNKKTKSPVKMSMKKN